MAQRLQYGVAFVFLASMIELIGAHYYDNHILAGYGAQPLTFKLSLDDCIATCGDNCNAVSYSYRYGYCVITTCGNMELRKTSGDWFTLVFGNPVVAGETVPLANHEWGLTESCGLSSVGSYRTPSFFGTGFDFQNTMSPIYGKALHFPNTATSSGIYVNTLPDPSVSAYAAQDVSFSVAFYVYFNVLPPNAELFEFMTEPGSFAWHFWLYPNINTPYANLVNAAGSSLGMTWARTFQANQWNHMAFTFDASAGTLAVYVNGTLLSVQRGQTGAKRRTDRIYLGGRPYADNLGFYNGSIFCLSTYNQTLTREEIVELQRSCNDGKIRFL
jgi:hypothetical protein